MKTTVKAILIAVISGLIVHSLTTNEPTTVINNYLIIIRM